MRVTVLRRFKDFRENTMFKMLITAMLLALILTAPAHAELGASQTVVPSRVTPDKTPNRFSFVDRTGVKDQTNILSNTVTVRGLGAGVRVPVRIATQSGGPARYSINGGAFRTSQTTVKNGDKLRLRNRVPTAGGSASVKLAVGTLSDTWNIVAMASGGGGGGGGSGAGARACFNPIFAVAGTRSAAEHLVTSPFSTYTSISESVVLGPTIFNGNAVNEHLDNGSIVYSNPANNFAIESRSYFKVDPANFRNFQYGSISAPAGQAPTPDSTHINDPFVEIRFDLDLGQSHTTRSTSGSPAGPRSSVELTRTYLGRETVTVPAGSFETCKFMIVTTGKPPAGSPIPGSTVTSFTWYDVGSGLTVKTEFPDGASKTELVSGSINGTPID